MQDSVILVDELHGICARFKQLFTGTPQAGHCSSPNSPVTMGNSPLTNVPAQPCVPSCQTFEQEPRLWTSGDLFQHIWLKLFCPATGMALFCHNLQTRKVGLPHRCPHLAAHAPYPMLINHFSLAYKDAVSPPEDYQRLHKTSSIS